MNRLEILGLSALLDNSIAPLEARFHYQVRDGNRTSIPNGSACPACLEYGGGTVGTHLADCSGVQLVKDIVVAYRLLMDIAPAEPA